MTKHTRELLGTGVGCFAGYGMLLSFGGGLAQLDLARYLLLAGIGIALLVMMSTSSGNTCSGASLVSRCSASSAWLLVTSHCG